MILSLRFLLLIALLSASINLSACGSEIQGTYSNDNGFATLDLKSGGTALFSTMGRTSQCNYKKDGDKIQLSCGKENLTLIIHDDGSLTAEGIFIGTMRKKK
jgi:hypothetical protein